MIQKLTKNSIAKNCKNGEYFVKNSVKTAKNSKICKNLKDLTTLQIKHLAIIKTLLNVHDNLPNIIKVVDTIIAQKASSPLDGSFIFGDLSGGTYSQMQSVIDLSDRKVSLINLYCLIDTMVASLPHKLQEVVKLKFYKHKRTSYLSEEFDVDERTVFRWANDALLQLLDFCKTSNWSIEFLLCQMEREGWMLEHCKQNYKNLIANATKCCK